MRKNMNGNDMYNVVYTKDGIKSARPMPEYEIVSTGNKSLAAKLTEMAIALGLLTLLIILVVNIPAILGK